MPRVESISNCAKTFFAWARLRDPWQLAPGLITLWSLTRQHERHVCNGLSNNLQAVCLSAAVKSGVAGRACKRTWPDLPPTPRHRGDVTVAMIKTFRYYTMREGPKRRKMAISVKSERTNWPPACPHRSMMFATVKSSGIPSVPKRGWSRTAR